MNFIKISNKDGNVATTESTTTTVKLAFAGNIHRLTLKAAPEKGDQLYLDLMAAASRLVGGKTAILRYLDEDEDLIRVDSAEALAEALDWGQSQGKVLKLRMEAGKAAVADKKAQQKLPTNVTPVAATASNAPAVEAPAAKAAPTDKWVPDKARWKATKKALKAQKKHARQAEKKAAKLAFQEDKKAAREKLQALRIKLTTAREAFGVARKAFCTAKKSLKEAKKAEEYDLSDSSPSATDSGKEGRRREVQALKADKASAKDVFLKAKQRLLKAREAFKEAKHALKHVKRDHKKAGKKKKKKSKKSKKESKFSGSESSSESSETSESSSTPGSSSDSSDHRRHKHGRHRHKHGHGRPHHGWGRGRGRGHGHGRGGRWEHSDPEERKARREQRQKERKEFIDALGKFLGDKKVVSALQVALPMTLDLLLKGSASTAIEQVLKELPILANHPFIKRILPTINRLAGYITSDIAGVTGNILVDLFAGLEAIFEQDGNENFNTSKAVLMLLRQCKRRVFHHIRGEGGCRGGRGGRHGMGPFNPMAIFRFIKKAARHHFMGDHRHGRKHGRHGHGRWD